MLSKIKGFVSSVCNAVKRNTQKFAVAVFGGTAAATVAVNAHAAGNYTVPTIDLSDVYTAFGVLLTAVGAIWVGKKIYGFFNR